MMFYQRAFKNLTALIIASLIVAATSDVPESVRNSFLNSPLKSVFPRPGQIDIERVVAPLKKRIQPARTVKLVRHTVAHGDTLSKIWENNGASTDSAVLAAKALSSLGSEAKTLRVGERLALLVNQEGEIAGLRKKISAGRMVVLKREADDSFSSRILLPEIQESERVVSATIYSSFSKAALEASLSYEVVDELVDLFGARIDFRRDLQPGDTFTVIYNDRRTKRGDFIQPGEIRAAILTNNGNSLVAVRHEGQNGQVRYFDENGKILGDYFLRYPVQFTRVSSVFSKTRLHPILGVARPHHGVDFAAPTGTPVRSVADGVICDVGFKKHTGNMVRIKHDGRYTTEYFHLSRITAGLRAGTRVARGQVIGAVGMTGLATAPHLHFGFFENGKYVDPLKVKLPSAPADGETIPRGYLMATLDLLRSHQDAIRTASNRGKTEQQSPVSS